MLSILQDTTISSHSLSKRLSPLSTTSDTLSPLLKLFGTQRIYIVSMLFQILLESEVLEVDRVLADVWQECKSDDAGEYAKSAGHEEGILALLDDIITRRSNNIGEDISSNEGADLANGGCNSVVLTTNAGRTSLGCHKADIVARSKFAKGKLGSCQRMCR